MLAKRDRECCSHRKEEMLEKDYEKGLKVGGVPSLRKDTPTKRRGHKLKRKTGVFSLGSRNFRTPGKTGKIN